MGNRKTKCQIANIHAQILKTYMNTGSCQYIPISNEQYLREMIRPVDCDNELIDFLKANHIILNESTTSWGWPRPFPLYERNCIILQTFINEINTIPLYGYVNNLFYFDYKFKIENQIINAYTKFLYTTLDNSIDSTETLHFISHFLIRDYKEKTKIKNAAENCHMKQVFKSFICNDNNAIKWWNDNKSQVTSYITWINTPEKPEELSWYRIDCISSAKQRSIFLANEDLRNSLGNDLLNLTDYIFGLGDMAGSIVDLLKEELPMVEPIYCKDFFNTEDIKEGEEQNEK